ncbi:hypothetical protein [Paenisporosarcina sp. TG-14]|uniref:hypothetical protein n=1 Tax=Paenisporosarcina sp. TG-14 TaxID=1231057 RepID=UPI000364E8B5|nr:hypothetical protein [Paenisporosarcina sp. TG-14]
MNNNQGFSFVETILTVSILFLIFGTLMPFTNLMKLQLAEKREALHVAITKNQAATAIKNGDISGVVILDDVGYVWEWSSPILCVNYVIFEVSYESCDTY